MAENTLKEKFSEQSFTLQRFLFVVALIGAIVLTVTAGIHYAQASDPYTREVLALTGNGTRGEEIFQANCVVCHGLEARGEVGPSLVGVSARKSKTQLIDQVVSGKTPPMPQFQPDPQDMADLLKYLEKL
ncbi:MAG: c-type cytochrome [Leptolyngbyaceae cyanobacterium]